MNSNLISKNISGYFDELINKQIITPPPKQSSMSTFYKNYVEHNLLLIFIIIFIIIFLIFKYFTKSCNDDLDADNKKKEDKKENKKKEKEREKKLRERINKERELLAKEKSEILSIIDELSEMNYKRVIPKNIQEEDTQYKKINNQDSRINNKNKINYNSTPVDFEAYKNNENYSDDYYDIKDNKSELIDGVYFETPYN